MNSQTTLPGRDEMIRALRTRDVAYQGVFFVGVRSTGIFCRIGCPARMPRENQLEFFATARDALFGGFRPCKRCLPMEPPGAVPEWLQALMKAVDSDPEVRWTDSDIRALKLQPDRVRRWFQRNHGMTFLAYARARRLGLALTSIRNGSSVVTAALDHGYDSVSGFNAAFQGLLGTNPTTATRLTVINITRVLTPLGPMIACATNSALCLLDFADRRQLETQLRSIQKRIRGIFVPASNAILEQTVQELDGYFRGTLQRFSVPLIMAGSAFQVAVWERLRDIPYGETRSYRQIAGDIHAPKSVRAVGRANGDNRISIIVPCHRVVGTNGELTGYGGGLWRKRRLIDLEHGTAVPAVTAS